VRDRPNQEIGEGGFLGQCYRSVWAGLPTRRDHLRWVLELTVVGMLRGMSEAGGPGDKAQELKAQVTQKVREVRAQAIARVPQLTGAAAQKTQRVVRDKPGAAVGAALAVLGWLILRRRQRRREKAKRAQQVRGRSRTSRARRWARVLAVLGFVIRRRRRRRGREEDS
jgi:ElaB/YqjD/DUF883 family membrane-anchored ribosome-binding protein